MKRNSINRRSHGFTLIEVLVGILVFALGMMALRVVFSFQTTWKVPR